MDKSDQQLKALAEESERVKVGDREFKIYPITPGKLSMINGVIEKFAPVVDEFGKIGQGKDSLFTQRLKEAIDEILDAIVIITMPNTGKAPDITSESAKEIREYFKWSIEGAQAGEIVAILLKSASVGEPLKNVLPPRGTRNSPGQPTSDLSSSSPNGPSTTSSGESQLEV